MACIEPQAARCRQGARPQLAASALPSARLRAGVPARHAVNPSSEAPRPTARPACGDEAARLRRTATQAGGASGARVVWDNSRPCATLTEDANRFPV
jgi:hypothetical protein